MAATGALLWSVSGMLHPLLVRASPPVAGHGAPALTTGPAAGRTSALKTPAEIAATARIDQAVSLRLIAYDGAPYYQLQTAPAAIPRYFNAVSGHELPDGDRRYARTLARHYVGDDTSPLRDIRRVAAFGGEYDAVNRLLPVYRVAFERPDNLRAYVDTTTSMNGALVDDRKAILDWLFRNLHKWDWLRGVEPLRLGVALALVLAAAVTAASGIIMYLKTARGRRRGLRLWHRRAGLIASLVLLAFATSGGVHLVKMSMDAPVSAPARQAAMALHGITAAPDATMLAPGFGLRALALVRVGDAYYYRVERLRPPGAGEGRPAGRAARGHHGASGRGTEVLYVPVHGDPGNAVTPQQHAREVALTGTSLPASRVTGVGEVRAFGGEYGFVNKYLPVMRVDFDTAARDAVYVHTASGRIAARIDDPDRAEGWLFAYAHKWNLLDPLGRDLRDGAMALAALVIAGVTFLGMALFLRAPGGR